MERNDSERGSWEPMSIRYVGDVGDVVQMTTGTGQGKTANAHDPGDVFKPPGQG